MTEIQSAAIAAIEEQQKGLKRGTVWMVGEQLKDICRREERSAELIGTDLRENKDMSLQKAEAKIRTFVKGNGGCASPWEAESILREFYGLGEPLSEPELEQKKPEKTGKVVNLADFL